MRSSGPVEAISAVASRSRGADSPWEINNLLNRANATGYTCSADYAARKSQSTYFAHRVLVGGAIFPW